MNIRKLRLEHVGQIKKAEIEFGDLTVFVGPQASGKSIFLQLFKLLVDSGSICDTLQLYGLDWRKRSEFLDVYLGEGMGAVWKSESKLLVNGKRKLLKDLTNRTQEKTPESLFYIPAHRVLTMGKGWPLPFSDYSSDDPFVVRDFSDKLRQLMPRSASGKEVFPQHRRISVSIRDRLQQDVFAGFGLQVEKHDRQKRLVLQRDDLTEPLSFMAWSAGQREFVPLLLGFYWLLPPAPERRREKLEWVVIEELEMGLHPRAIAVALLLVLDLLSRGYRVCLSTHSQHVLDLVWALGILQKRGAKPERLLELFDVAANPNLKKMATQVMQKRAKVYFFDRETGIHDISSLNPGASDAAVADWGGLSEFSSRASDVVADVINETE